MKKSRKGMAVLLAAALLASLTACSGSSETSAVTSAAGTTVAAGSAETTAADTEAVYDSTITMAFTTAWDSLMPYYSASGSMYTKELINFIYDRLAFISDGGTTIKPRAAESWESADDGYSIIFHLNPDCKWHDGEPVTAEDWVYTMELFTDKDAASVGIACDAADVFVGTENGVRVDGEEFGAEAVDEYTLKLTFKAPWTPEDFLAKYCRDISVLPKHLLEDIAVSEMLDSDFWSAPVGSGPCIFESETIGSEIYLKANRDYQFPVTGFGTLKGVVMSSANTLQAIISGDIDLVSLGSQVTVSNAEVAEAAGIEVGTNDKGTSFVEMILNNDSLDDVNLRLAIYYALDREKGAEIATQGLGYVVDSYVLPFSEYCNTDLKREYDVEKAKEYLAKSNYDGRTLQFAVGSNRAEIAAYFQQNLEAAGIHVEIVNVDVSTMFSGLKAGTYDMGISGHTGSAYPLWFGYTVLASSYGNTYFSVSDPGYEEIYDAALAETAPDKKKELINEFQEYIFNNVPWIPLYYANTMYTVAPKVTGVDYNSGAFCNDNTWEWVKAE